MEEEKNKLEENPNSELANSTKRLRQRYFKAKFQRRKTIGLVLSSAKPTTTHETISLKSLSPKNKSPYEYMDDTYGSDSDSQ